MYALLYLFQKQSKANVLNLYKNGKQANMHLVPARLDDIYGVFPLIFTFTQYQELSYYMFILYTHLC